MTDSIIKTRCLECFIKAFKEQYGYVPKSHDMHVGRSETCEDCGKTTEMFFRF